MYVDSKVAKFFDRDGTRLMGGLIALTAVAALFVAPSISLAAGSGPTGPSTSVKFEAIPGSKIKRVILTARAAERLGIETAEVSKKRIVRKQMVGGQVTHPLKIQAEQRSASAAFGSFGKTAVQPVAVKAPKLASIGTWISVVLSEEEWARIATDVPARILPLGTRGKLPKELTAKPSSLKPLFDAKRSMLRIYYVVPGSDAGLKTGDRMRLELQLSGSNKERMVVPYSALYYDGEGKPWVYTTEKPLVYERKRVSVERIVGESAVLTDGPPLGTKVVTVGSALLYGAEVIYKR